MSEENKKALLDHINRAIILLGSLKIRVDEISPIGFQVSEAIQHLGECSRLINEENNNEQESGNKPE